MARFFVHFIKRFYELQVFEMELHLTSKDKEAIQNNSRLDDRVINAAQTILKRQFPDVSGWQDAILSQTSFVPIPVDSVQIHHDQRRQHWVCSSSIHESIQVFDSLFETLSTSMQIQLAQCYRFAINVDILEVQVPSVQRQSDAVDCGLFAIAFAYELASGNEHSMQSKQFEQQMRDHLIRCLENDQFESFPGQSSKKRRRDEPNIFEIELFCHCLMPEMCDDIILCDLCDIFNYIHIIYISQ